MLDGRKSNELNAGADNAEGKIEQPNECVVYYFHVQDGKELNLKNDAEAVAKKIPQDDGSTKDSETEFYLVVATTEAPLAKEDLVNNPDDLVAEEGFSARAFKTQTEVTSENTLKIVEELNQAEEEEAQASMASFVCGG